MAQAILLLIMTEVLALSLHHKIQHCGLVNPWQSNGISNTNVLLMPLLLLLQLF